MNFNFDPFSPSTDHSGPTPKPLGVGLLTVSDSRGLDTDTSGALLQKFVESAGHRLEFRRIVPDDVSAIRSVVCDAMLSESCAALLITGGTGITQRDVTPEALEPLVTKQILGFGELFRQLSYEQIGAATIQSRAQAGLCGNTLVFALPGSTGAVRLAVEKILWPQLDVRQKPCNFAQLLPRVG